MESVLSLSKIQEDERMKRQAYTTPQMRVTLIRCQLLISTSGLDGVGDGGSTGGKEADAREGLWDDEE